MSDQAVDVDPKNTKAVKNVPIPLTPTDIHIFLRLAGYHRRLVEGFSFIASWLKALTQKKAMFDWEDTSENIF